MPLPTARNYMFRASECYTRALEWLGEGFEFKWSVQTVAGLSERQTVQHVARFGDVKELQTALALMLDEWSTRRTLL